MRLALISDIHGNAVALKTVLDELEQENLQQIICLGDVSAGGPQPSETLEKIEQLDCPVVMGNADEWLVEPEEAESTSEALNHFEEIGNWCAEQLSEEQLSHIRSFDTEIKTTLDDETRLFCYHGSPRSHSEGIRATTSEPELDDLFAGTNAEIFIGGHTHVQLFRRYRDSIVLNPGSIGLPFEQDPTTGAFYNPPRAEYAILTQANGSLTVELRRTPVSSDAIVKAAHESDMPYADRWTDDWETNR